MTQEAVSEACRRAREQGAEPISAVDDLSMHKIGPWINTFSACLARSAKREGISIVGGEMAQMPDSYAENYIGIWVTVVSIGAS
jgi:phosphoribosylaminoimidazole (AIR) synthetase